MNHLSSASAFLLHSLGLTPEGGTEHGICTTCGCETHEGLTLKQGFSAILGKGFTDWNRCSVTDDGGIVCPSCSMMAKGHPSKVVSLFKSRLRRCLVTESGEILMVGTDRRLKYILQHLPDEPFLLMDSRRSPAKFMHHIWMSRISMEKKAFYYCDDFGNHLIRLSHIEDISAPDKTVMENRLCQILHDDNKQPEEPRHPSDLSYN